MAYLPVYNYTMRTVGCDDYEDNYVYEAILNIEMNLFEDLSRPNNFAESLSAKGSFASHPPFIQNILDSFHLFSPKEICLKRDTPHYF